MTPGDKRKNNAATANQFILIVQEIFVRVERQ